MGEKFETNELFDITVITVVYNCVNEISKTINSVLPLLDNKHELLVIDGGSTDGTLELLKSYFHPSYRVYSERDHGIYDVMNKGASLAKGKWITYINSGDLLIQFPKKMSEEYDAMCFAVRTENGVILPQYNRKLYLCNTIPHQGMYYRKSKFMGFDLSYKIFSDYDYNLHLYKRGAKLLIGNDVVAFHSLQGVSNSNAAKHELLELMKRELCPMQYFLALFRFRVLGVITRIQKIVVWLK